MVNTEKPQTIAQKKQMQSVETSKKNEQIDMPVKTEDKKDDVKKENTEEKKEEKKKIITKPKINRGYAISNGKNLHISTKYACAICKFIKNKSIPNAITDLEDVIKQKKAVPMKGEIPHRKGKIMSGRFPKKASGVFITLLKNLQGNANQHDIDNPVIYEAIANIAERPFGRFGRWQRKRTHVTIKARTKKNKEKKNDK